MALFQRNLNQILGTFTKAQTELENYITLEATKNETDQEEIVRLEAQRDARTIEIERAQRVRDKVIAITS